MSNGLNLCIAIERAICRSLVKELIHHGFFLAWDGGDLEIEDIGAHRVPAELLHGTDGMFNYDEGHLLVWKKPKRVGSDRLADEFVRIVFGNDGWDVISDYSSSLEPYIKNTLAFAEQLEDIDIDDLEKAIAKLVKREAL